MVIKFSNKQFEIVFFTMAVLTFIVFLIEISKDGSKNTFFPLYFMQSIVLGVGVFYLKHLRIGIKILTITEAGLKIQFFSKAEKIINLEYGTFFVKINEKSIDFFKGTETKKIGHASYIELVDKDQWEEMEKLLRPFLFSQPSNSTP